MAFSFSQLPPRASLRTLGLCAFVLLLSLAPTIGTLGYFYSLATTPLAALWGIHLGRSHASYRPPRPRPGGSTSELMDSATRGFPEVALQSGVWMILLALCQLWAPSCAFESGLAFWALGPLCSLLLGWGMALLTLRVWGQRRFAWLLPYALFIACTLWGLLRIYLAPVVFAFDPFWGYFSGPIYDEVVTVQPRYLFYRAYNFAWLASAACLVRFYELRPQGRRWLSLGLASLICVLYPASQREHFGWSASSKSLQEELSLERRTQHFVIRYAPYSMSAAQIEALAFEHEFAWHRLSSKLGYAPPSPIESFVFSSPGQKRRIFGAGRVEVSLPWRQQIYLNHQDAPHQILHHELAHAFGRVVGDPLFGLSAKGLALNGGLIEGYATALAPRSVGNLDLHDQAAIVDRIDKRPPLSELMGMGFWRYASSRAYTSAGSFCLWLLENYGPKVLSEIYQRSGGYKEFTGKSLEELESAWVAFLKTRVLSDEDLATQRARYARRSVFDRPCAHRIAVAGAEVSRLSANGEDQKAIELLREICRVDPGELGHQIRLAKFLSDHQDPKGAQAVLEAALGRADLRVRQRARLLQVQADLSWRAGELAAAEQSLDKALTLVLPDYLRRVLLVKKHALGLPGPQRDALLSYFRPGDKHEPEYATAATRLHAAQRLSELAPNDSLGPYLTGLVWLSRQAPEPAALALQEALARNAWPAPLLEDYALQTLRVSALRLGKLDLARDAHNKLKARPGQKSGQVLRHTLWDERLDYAEQHPF